MIVKILLVLLLRILLDDGFFGRIDNWAAIKLVVLGGQIFHHKLYRHDLVSALLVQLMCRRRAKYELLRVHIGQRMTQLTLQSMLHTVAMLLVLMHTRTQIVIKRGQLRCFSTQIRQWLLNASDSITHSLL